MPSGSDPAVPVKDAVRPTVKKRTVASLQRVTRAHGSRAALDAANNRNQQSPLEGHQANPMKQGAHVPRINVVSADQESTAGRSNIATVDNHTEQSIVVNGNASHQATAPSPNTGSQARSANATCSSDAKPHPVDEQGDADVTCNATSEPAAELRSSATLERCQTLEGAKRHAREKTESPASDTKTERCESADTIGSLQEQDDSPPFVAFTRGQRGRRESLKRALAAGLQSEEDYGTIAPLNTRLITKKRSTRRKQPPAAVTQPEPQSDQTRQQGINGSSQANAQSVTQSVADAGGNHLHPLYIAPKSLITTDQSSTGSVYKAGEDIFSHRGIFRCASGQYRASYLSFASCSTLPGPSDLGSSQIYGSCPIVFDAAFRDDISTAQCSELYATFSPSHCKPPIFASLSSIVDRLPRDSISSALDKAHATPKFCLSSSSSALGAMDWHQKYNQHNRVASDQLTTSTRASEDSAHLYDNFHIPSDSNVAENLQKQLGTGSISPSTQHYIEEGGEDFNSQYPLEDVNGYPLQTQSLDPDRYETKDSPDLPYSQ